MRSAPISVNFALSSLTGTSPDNDDEGVRFAKALVDNGSVELERLLELQNKVCEPLYAILSTVDGILQGWHNESIQDHFQKQRKTADTASMDLTRMWFERMKTILREIDARLCCIPARMSLNFLDLGCCPGGFASYILDQNSYANGFGISLPVADGGHEFALEDYHRSRFQLSCMDLTYFQLGPSIIDDHRLRSLPSPIKERSFNLALLDGHQLRTQAAALPWDRDRLLVSQLILALQAVKEGGTIIVKLPLPHKLVSAKILYFFSTISRRLLRWKPKSMHRNRGTFYAVAKGIGKGLEGPRIPTILLELKKLWLSLTFGGEEGNGRRMTPEDLDFLVATDEIFSYHLDWLMEFGTPLWRVQRQGLEGMYQQKGLI